MSGLMLDIVWDQEWKSVLIILLLVAVFISIIVIICLALVHRKGRPVTLASKEELKKGKQQPEPGQPAAVVQQQVQNVAPLWNYPVPPLPADFSQRVGYVPPAPEYTVVPLQPQTEEKDQK